MKIVVLGATGLTGAEVVSQALELGHQVVAYVRRPEAIESRPGLEVVAGSLDDVAALTAAIKGTDAVICSIGPKLDLKTLRDSDLMQRTMPSIVAAMIAAQTARLVLVSAFGVADTAAKASVAARLVYRLTMSGIYGDKAKAEAELPGSGLNWTTVYPVILTNDPRKEHITVQSLATVDKVPGLPKVARANVATVLLDLAGEPDKSGERILITS